MAKKTHAKIERTKDNYRALNLFIETHGIDAKEIAPYQCRCNEVLDVYTTNKKFFLLQQCKWGKYEDINELLTYLQK